MKVFISADIEGITGIVSWSQAGGPDESLPDWDFSRRMYTHDVNSAIRGARAAGAKEVVVKDSHNLCKNLLISDLEPGTRLISGAGATPHGMMEGIQEGFDAAMLVGYHARAGAYGVMSHALVGGLHRFWINDEEAGEIAFSAATAGAYGTPLVAVTSDDCGCAEAAETVIGVKTFAVKKSLGSFMTDLLHPSVTGPGIEEACRLAVSQAEIIQPYKIEGPVEMRVQFQHPQLSELPGQIPGVLSLDKYTLEWTCPSYLEAAKLAYAVFDMSQAGRNLQK